MKHLVITTALSLCVLPSIAQQALWSGKKIVSPEINPDTTVTFRLNAPTANQVYVTGDFLPAEKISTPNGTFEAPGKAELTKNANGLWEYTSARLFPELYSYSFIVDNLQITDPSNVFQNRDVASITNIFIIPGDRATNYVVNDVPHGTVSRMWYDSPTLGMKRRISVYTPAGYEQSAERYPVFYLLHGMGGDEEAWLSLGRASQILDNLIATGKAKPMIVVMTNGNASQEAAPGETHFGLKQPNMNLPKTMEGSFETAFPDVVKFIDATFRTENDKAHRAIAGLSMGGFHACHISKQYPDMFDYIGLFSAAIFPMNETKSPVYDDMEKKLKIQFEKNPKLYWIGIGNKDFLYNVNSDFRHILDTNNHPYTYFETSDGHIWKNWRIYLTEFTPLLFK